MPSTRLTGRKRWATERFHPQKKGRRRWQDQKRHGYKNHADDRRKRYAVVGVHAFGESGGGQCLGELGRYSRDEEEAETNALRQGGGTKSNARSAGSSTSGDSLCATSITTISSKGLYNLDAYLQFSRGFETASNSSAVLSKSPCWIIFSESVVCYFAWTCAGGLVSPVFFFFFSVSEVWMSKRVASLSTNSGSVNGS